MLDRIRTLSPNSRTREVEFESIEQHEHDFPVSDALEEDAGVYEAAFNLPEEDKFIALLALSGFHIRAISRLTDSSMTGFSERRDNILRSLKSQ